jgi:hypothetical protein
MLNDGKFDEEELRKFEEANPHISIDIYRIHDTEAEGVKLYYASMNKTSRENHIDLGFLQKDDMSHFVLIRKLHLLFTEKYNNDHHRKFFCYWCNFSSTYEEGILKHYNECEFREKKKVDPWSRVKLPSERHKDKLQQQEITSTQMGRIC